MAARLLGDIDVFESLVRHGRADTPFGSLDAPEGFNGETVKVLVRPEGLAIARSDDE